MRVLYCAADAKTLSDQLVLVLMQSFWPGGIPGNLAVQLVEYVDRHFIQRKQLESMKNLPAPSISGFPVHPVVGQKPYGFRYVSQAIKQKKSTDTKNVSASKSEKW